jgi:hypothetical protein
MEHATKCPACAHPASSALDNTYKERADVVGAAAREGRKMGNKFRLGFIFAAMLVVAWAFGYLSGKDTADRWYAEHPVLSLKPHIVQGMALEGDCRIVPPTTKAEELVVFKDDRIVFEKSGPCFIGANDMVVKRKP